MTHEFDEDIWPDDWKVFPVAAGGKAPATRAWLEDAKPLSQWNGALSCQNIGVLTGANDLLVVDEDQAGAADAIVTQATFTVETGRGRHYYFKNPPDWIRPGNYAPGLDIKCGNSYVVGPTSVHETGVIYEVIDSREPAPVPADLLSFLEAHVDRDASPAGGPMEPTTGGDDDYGLAALEAEARVVETTPPGGRNAALNSACFRMGQLVGGGHLDASTACERLSEAGLAAGLPRREVDQVLRNSASGGLARGRQRPRRAEQYEIELADRSPAADEAFWEARPLLTAVRDFARERRVGPWALLGAVLARAAASVSPGVVLPPVRASEASLNIFVALCSSSGGGKSGVVAAAADFLRPEHGVEFLEASPGSGEGVIAAYGEPRVRKKGEPAAFVRTRESVLFSVDEIGALGALGSRTATTLLPILKSSWSGSAIGTQNAEAARNRHLDRHTYRLAMVAGVQPEHARVLLDDAGGGFPQRWLWMPTYDHGRTESTAEGRAEPWRWSVPIEAQRASGGRRSTLRLPGETVEAILDAAERENRPIGAPVEGDGLDGHALLSRVKVAALLALLDRRGRAVTAEDWGLAGHVMAVSDATRSQIIEVNKRAADQVEDRKAQRAGRSAEIAADAQAETRVVAGMDRVLALLRKDGGEMPRGRLENRIGRYAEVIGEVMERLLSTGQVEVETRENARGREVEYVALAGGAS